MVKTGSKNANEVMVATMVGTGGVCLGDQFCVCAFVKSLASVAVKTFSNLIYSKKI